MRIAFLLTSPYQVYHYKEITKHLPDPVTIIIEDRDRDYGLTEQFIINLIPGCKIKIMQQKNLNQLDGLYDAIICQTPILPNMFLKKTYVIAEQYSMAKESYQYGIWRAQAHLNLMYGPYSENKVNSFCHAVATGNPMLDPLFEQQSNQNQVIGTSVDKPHVLYLPTYGELSSLAYISQKLTNIHGHVTVKLHHAEDKQIVEQLPDNIKVVYSDADPIELLNWSDCVLADFSGSAFDAIYAKKPLVLIKRPLDQRAEDYKRLSDEEKNYHLLHDIAAVWDGVSSFDSCLEEAKQKMSNVDLYDSLANKLFVNRGHAGKACADAVIELIESGEPDHFARDQIRESVQRYIKRNRKLSIQVNKLKKRKLSIRKRLAKVSVLKKIYRKIRGINPDKIEIEGTTQNELDALSYLDEMGITPTERRASMSNLITQHFKKNGIRYADFMFPDTKEIHIALFESEKVNIFQSLNQLDDSQIQIFIYLPSVKSQRNFYSVNDLKYQQIDKQPWIEVGVPHFYCSNAVAREGFIRLVFIKEENDRFLAIDTKNRKADWTVEFSTSNNVERIYAEKAMYKHPVHSVDVVYTWVDSNDIEWQKSRALFDHQIRSDLISADNEERYANRNELLYSLRSIWMYAPFVRNIYIITADQKPEWLNEDHSKIKLISHKEIFPEAEMLPTFNSHAIEACLHRIPGLSEYFLYFNDDVLLGNEISIEDFFSRGGLPKIRFSPSQMIIEHKPAADAIPTDWAAYNANSIIKQEFGIAFSRKSKHVPCPVRKSMMMEIEKKNSECIRQTRYAKVRSQSDIALTSMLYPFYSVASGKAIDWPNVPYEYMYIDTGRLDSLSKLKMINTRKPKFFCLNSTRYSEVSMEEQYEIIKSFLEKRFPYPSPYEKRNQVSPEPSQPPTYPKP